MLDSAFDLSERLELRKLSFNLSNELWKKWDIEDFDLNFANWQKTKYLNVLNNDLNDNINNIPDNKGGLYLFYLNCQTIIGITEMPLYIGRAQFTENQNLRKRIKEYFQKFIKSNERPKITKMFKYWAEDLNIAYYVIEENEDIRSIEKKIINSLLLPMNDVIPDQEIRVAKKAF
ncbi:GIY-YIG nuclease family protein [Sphingobacterium lactis]|uniref:GIY-YIG domain-containing protein n=1 Tax=Sphingobacterium lactis TaxID=797291 RepID=A0A1H5TWQ2_9SPHI|nr:hypothetical protein [Sphingobacterium lactis]SEF67199.1 hypothetical protein SAMN05421877_102103 [Sphingobacterium lactis]